MSADADLAALTALSPLDGRYAAKVAALAAHFSEYGLVRHRVRVELAWLAALADEPGIPELPPFSSGTRDEIARVAAAFGPADAAYCPDLCWPSRTAARTSCTVVSSPRACEAADFRR